MCIFLSLRFHPAPPRRLTVKREVGEASEASECCIDLSLPLILLGGFHGRREHDDAAKGVLHGLVRGRGAARDADADGAVERRQVHGEELVGADVACHRAVRDGVVRADAVGVVDVERRHAAHLRDLQQVRRVAAVPAAHHKDEVQSHLTTDKERADKQEKLYLVGAKMGLPMSRKDNASAHLVVVAIFSTDPIISHDLATGWLVSWLVS